MSFLDLSDAEQRQFQDFEEARRKGKKLSEKGEQEYLRLLREVLPETTATQRFLIGAGRGALDVYQGLKQLGLNASDATGFTENAADEYTADVNQDIALYNKLSEAHPYSTGAGRIAGNAAAAPVGGVGTGIATRALSGGLAGAAVGAAGYSEANTFQDRQRNAMLGGVGGAAGEAVGPAFRATKNWITGPRPQAAADVPGNVPVPTEGAGGLPGPEGIPGGPPPQAPPTSFWDEEFGIPYTRGQYEADIPQQMEEQRIMRGARGPGAQEDIEGLLNLQGERVSDAYQGVTGEMAAIPQGGRQLVPEGAEVLPEPRVLSEPEAGLEVRGELEQRANALYDQMSRAYDDAAQIGGEVTIEDARGVADAVRASAPIEDLVGPEITPNAHDVLKIVDRFIDEGEGTDRMSVAGINRMRRAVTNALRSNPSPSDARVLRNMRNSIDDASSALMDQGRIIGDPTGLAKIREGTRLRADYGRLYGPREKQLRSGRRLEDTAGKAIEEIIEKPDMTGKQVVDTVFGQSGLGAKKDTVQILQRVEQAAGRNSPEYQALRNAALMRFRETVRLRGSDQISPQKYSTQWATLRSKQPELLAQLFNAEELERLDDLAGAITRTGYDPRAVNTSNTGHMIEQMLTSKGGTAGVAATAMGYAGATVMPEGFGAAGMAGGAVAGAQLMDSVGTSVRNALGRTFGKRAYRPATTAGPGSILAPYAGEVPKAALGGAAARELDPYEYEIEARY